MRKLVMLLVHIMFVLLVAACSTSEEETFIIGVIPAQTEGEMETAINKLQEILTEKLDQTVEISVYPDYNGVVEAMNYNKINMAFLGPLTYVIAHEKSGAKAIVTQLIDGEPFYYSYIITHQDNKVNSLEDLLKQSEEVNFAFGDPNSTSGSLIPSIELKDKGVYSSEDENQFKSVRFTGSHDATALSIQNKQVDAGAIDSAIFNQLVESGKIDGSQVKVIWESDQLFQYPWAVNKDTDEKTIVQLQAAFLSISDKDILNAFGASGFTKASNENYKSILDAAIKQGIIQE